MQNPLEIQPEIEWLTPGALDRSLHKAQVFERPYVYCAWPSEHRGADAFRMYEGDLF